MTVAELAQTKIRSMPDLQEFMSTEEAASLLGFNVKSVRNMLANGKLTGQKIGSAWLVSRKSVRDYLKQTRGMNKNDPRRTTTSQTL